MHTTDLPAEPTAKAGVPPSPDERFRELAAIFAAGGGRAFSSRSLGNVGGLALRTRGGMALMILTEKGMC
jgi:hypothetical protein